MDTSYGKLNSAQTFEKSYTDTEYVPARIKLILSSSSPSLSSPAPPPTPTTSPARARAAGPLGHLPRPGVFLTAFTPPRPLPLPHRPPLSADAPPRPPLTPLPMRDRVMRAPIQMSQKSALSSLDTVNESLDTVNSQNSDFQECLRILKSQLYHHLIQ